MTRRPLALLIVLACLLALLPGGVARALECAPDDYVCQELLDAQKSQSATSDQLAKIQKDIKDVEKKMSALYQLIQQLNGKIAAQQLRVEATQREIEALDGRIRLTEADITRRQAHLEVREQLFGQRVRSMEKHGSINYLALLMSATSFNQLVDRLITAQTIVHSDKQLLGDLRQEKVEIEGLRSKLTDQRAEQADLLYRQQGEQSRLEFSRSQQRSALAYQQQLEAQYKAEADLLAKQKAEIDNKVTALQALYEAEARNAGGGTGQFDWPESPHILSQGFGCSPYPFEIYWPSCPSRHFHTGIDIAVPYGTPVVAADNGVVTVSSTPYGYGNLAIVTHGNGYTTVYGHLAGFAIRNGQLVYRGQVIAYEGSSGNSTGPHLHFEIRYNGNYVDPCLYLGC